MSSGKRYDENQKLNYKKVFGVIIAFAVFVMMIILIVNMFKNNKNKIEPNKTTYYASYENGKFGVINSKGETVINAQYDELIAVPDNTKAVFVCTYDVNDADGSYKTKVVNEKNEEILSGYETIEAIDNYDSKQNIWFSDSVLRAKKDGKYGLIDFNGNRVVDFEYDEIISLPTIKNEFLVKRAGNVGLVNEKGQFIIPVQYKEIKVLKDGYNSEYIIINENDQCGLIGTSGIVLIEPTYQDVKYLGSSSMFAVKEENVWKLYNTESKSIVINDGYQDIVSAKNDEIIVVKDEKYGVIKSNAEEIIAPQYDNLKFVFSIYYIAKKDDKFGIINSENAEVIPFEYINMTYVESASFIQADKSETESVILDNNLVQKASGIVSEINIEKGYVKIYTNNEYKYYNFKFEEKNVSDLLTTNTLFLSKKDGKYGFVDKSGKKVVDYIYDDGTEQNSCGFCAIKKDGVWGSINAVGVISKEPSVNLDSNIYVDFIGEWHLSNSGLYYEK